MNIEDFSKELGYSYKTVYRRIKVAGIDLKTLKNEAGELTDEGQQAITALFDKQTKNREIKPTEGDTTALQVVKGKTAQRQIETLTDEIESLRREVKEHENKETVLQSEIDCLRVQNELLTTSLESERKNTERLNVIIKRTEAIAEKEQQLQQQAQELHLMDLKRLLPTGDREKKNVKGLILRMFERRK